jgi:ectoine hydroxylase-related dioxygenase (phytanoyl-CoA dioxygenase family)
MVSSLLTALQHSRFDARTLTTAAAACLCRHQDEAYWSEVVAYEALGVWLALQPVSLSMGCMHFLPQSHRLSLSPLAHQTINKQSSVHGLELTDAQLVSAASAHSVAAPLGCGGATFHHCRTLHYTGRIRLAGQSTVNTLMSN